MAIMAGLLTLMGCTPKMGTSISTQRIFVTAIAPTQVHRVSTIDASVTREPTLTPKVISSPTQTLTPTPPSESACPSRDEIDLLSDILALGMMIFFDADETAGIVRFYSLSSSKSSPVSFLDDSSRAILSDYRVSPDGKWLAFVRARLDSEGVRHDELVLTASKYQEQQIIPWDTKTWGDLQGWLADSQQVVIAPPFDDNLLPAERPDKIIVFDPFAGQQHYISPSFPYSGGSIYDYWKYIGMSVVYDPTLNRVVYIDDEQTLVLWDVQGSRELWRFVSPGIIADNPAPVWAPNGAVMALATRLNPEETLDDSSKFEFLFISQEGKVTRSQPFPHYLGLERGLTSWSPNGRYLSFYWNAVGHKEKQLFLWDTKMQEFLDYCLTDVASEPIWSPDSRQFIVEADPSIGTDSSKVYRTLVVDVESNRIVQLNSNSYSPVAWIK